MSLRGMVLGCILLVLLNITFGSSVRLHEGRGGQAPARRFLSVSLSCRTPVGQDRQILPVRAQASPNYR